MKIKTLTIMKTNIFSAALCLSLASLTLSCDNESRVDDMNTVEYASPDENEQPINEEENQYDSDYKSFAIKAASEGMMEIELANIALEKSENPKVRELAETLKTEHSKANKKLKEIMQINTWQMPEEMTDNDAMNVEQISTMPKGKFDMHYLHMIGNNHTKSIALFEEFANKAEKSDSAYTDAQTTESGSGSTSQNSPDIDVNEYDAQDNYYPKLNNWIEATLPKLKKHMNKIEEVQMSMEEKSM